MRKWGHGICGPRLLWSLVLSRREVMVANLACVRSGFGRMSPWTPGRHPINMVGRQMITTNEMQPAAHAGVSPHGTPLDLDISMHDHRSHWNSSLSCFPIHHTCKLCPFQDTRTCTYVCTTQLSHFSDLSLSLSLLISAQISLFRL